MNESEVHNTIDGLFISTTGQFSTLKSARNWFCVVRNALKKLTLLQNPKWCTPLLRSWELIRHMLKLYWIVCVSWVYILIKLAHS